METTRTETTFHLHQHSHPTVLLSHCPTVLLTGPLTDWLLVDTYQDGGHDQGAIGQRVGHVGRLPPLVVRHVEAAGRVPGSNLQDRKTPSSLAHGLCGATTATRDETKALSRTQIDLGAAQRSERLNPAWNTTVCYRDDWLEL